MPPVSRGRAAHAKQQKKRKAAARAAPKSYSKAMTKGNKNGLFRISTFVPKVSYLRLRYNQTYLLDGSNLGEYYQIAVEMNSPNSPLIQFRGTQPSHAHTNTVGNFSADLAPIFQQYDHGVVTKSVCKCSIRPFSGNHQAGYHGVTAGPGTEQNPYYTQWTDPIIHAENVAWSANVDSLTGIGIGPDIHTLRDDTPGVQQKRLVTYPNSTKGIVFTNSYTPQRALGIKDIGDNQARVGFTNGVETAERSYTQIGVQPLFNNAAHPTGTTNRMASMIMTIQLDYVMKFTERKSVNNISRPTDHSEEL